MNTNTRKINVKVDERLARLISEMSAKHWSESTHSNGKRYVHATFEEITVIGKIG